MILHSVLFGSAKVVHNKMMHGKSCAEENEVLQKKMMYCKSCTEDEYSMVLTTTIVHYISKIQMSCVGLEEYFKSNLL